MFLLRHGLQVRGVAALATVALVVDLVSLWDVALEQLVDQAVDIPELALVVGVAVAAIVLRTYPIVAAKLPHYDVLSNLWWQLL